MYQGRINRCGGPRPPHSVTTKLTTNLSKILNIQRKLHGILTDLKITTIFLNHFLAETCIITSILLSTVGQIYVLSLFIGIEDYLE